jgi:hypothetical protein
VDDLNELSGDSGDKYHALLLSLLSEVPWRAWVFVFLMKLDGHLLAVYKLMQKLLRFLSKCLCLLWCFNAFQVDFVLGVICIKNFDGIAAGNARHLALKRCRTKPSTDEKLFEGIKFCEALR